MIADLREHDSERFTQCRFAFSVRVFAKEFLARHKLRAYHDLRQPAIFRGMYHDRDYVAVLKHRAPAVVIWCGGDALHPRMNRIKQLRGQANVMHLAQSRAIARSLTHLGLRHKLVHLHGSTLTAFPLCPLGSAVYVYLPSNRLGRFRADLVKQVMRALPKVKWLICRDARLWTRKQVIAVYRRSAIGVRLTQHDGCANTVLELGMMGRHCVHNGDAPTALHWKSVPEVIGHIKTQLAMQGRVHDWMPDAIKRYVDDDGDWSRVSFWFGAGGAQ